MHPMLWKKPLQRPLRKRRLVRYQLVKMVIPR